jgi:MFS family permease
MATLVQQAQTPTFRKPSTLSALRNANFRLYFIGQLVSISGTWMQNIAQSYLVFLITKSELWLGIVACAAGLPMVLLSPIGGVVVERVPRRTVLRCTQAVQMILAFILAALTFTNVIQVWHIVVLAILLGMTNAFDTPARQAFVVEIVGKEDLYSGIALNSIMNSLGRVLGPTAAGIALVQFGASWCFLFNGVSFVAVLLSLFIMKVPFAIKSLGKSSPIRQLREGLAFARNDTLIPPLLLLAAVAGFLVLPILRLLPAYADLVLHSAEQGYAAVSVAEGTGAVIAGILVGWLSQRIGHGKLIGIAIGVNALANVLLAFMTDIPPAVLVTLFFGMSMVTMFVSLNTVIQTVVPDGFRSRVLSLYSLAMLGLSPFGALALGAIADKFGTEAALILNGILIAVLCGGILVRWPNLLHYHTGARKDIVTIPDKVAKAVGD